MAVRWIETNGGPLIAMPRELQALWEGVDPPSHGRETDAALRRGELACPTTDYDRACDVLDYLGVLTVGSGHALVLADEPLRTCFVPSGSGGTFVRWCYGESADDVEARLAALPIVGYEPDATRFPIDGTPVLVFDSALSGRQVEECLTIALPPDAYDLSTLAWEPDRHTSLILHRLERRYDAS
jgi:hypothetical protein